MLWKCNSIIFVYNQSGLPWKLPPEREWERNCQPHVTLIGLSFEIGPLGHACVSCFCFLSLTWSLGCGGRGAHRTLLWQSVGVLRSPLYCLNFGGWGPSVWTWLAQPH